MPPPRIMYIENKSSENASVPGLMGVARIGRVTFSKTGRTIYYNGKSLQSLNGTGFKANFYDIESGEEYWISGPKKNGADGLYGAAPDAYRSGRARRILDDHQKTAKQSSPQNHLDSLLCLTVHRNYASCFANLPVVRFHFLLISGFVSTN